jgi:hypothetical protein
MTLPCQTADLTTKRSLCLVTTGEVIPEPRVAVYNGSYPFPPRQDALVTPNKFLVFVEICSNIQSSAFITVDEIYV